jgi:dipeptidyl aminopeptidase/acylaminoacyl peptidase
MTVSPYGSWKSPITSDLVVQSAIGLDQVALDGDTIYWTEIHPQKQGRYLLHRAVPDGAPAPVTPDDGRFNVRTRVHEYGGGAFAVADGTVLFSNFSDQRLYRQPDGEPIPITPVAPQPAALRHADGVFARDRFICVREDHTGAGEAVNTIVAIDLAGEQAPQVLVAGNDFYASPRLSPDGRRLAWLAWNHPDMPWVAAEAWIGDITTDGLVANPRRLAGGPDEAVAQPQWSPDGDLWLVSDRGAGWWNLYRVRAHDLDAEHIADALEPMLPMAAEFARPQWQFGASCYAFCSAATVVLCFVRDGLWGLGRLDTRSKDFTPIETPFTDISQLRAGADRAVFIGGSATEAPALVDMDMRTGAYRIVRRSADIADELRPYFSTPEPVAFATTDGDIAHAFYYPPASPDFTASAGEKVPVLVKSHGGPTSATSSTLSLGRQYWTSRGIGLLDVDYRGSTGYGRAYRLKLARQWGIADVDDCVAGARFLVAERHADPDRLMISGGSAGGYTTLCALTPASGKTFAAGGSYYGVSDLEALARDTHKFESRYLDWLIGPYPAERATYVERSPISHVDRLGVPVIFFQGSEDKIVPPDQTELMVEALTRRGIAVGYLLFDGEQHGFRKADNIKRALDAELYFYAALVLRSGLRF